LNGRDCAPDCAIDAAVLTPPIDAKAGLVGYRENEKKAFPWYIVCRRITNIVKK
jgi:hypothetical protein